MRKRSLNRLCLLMALCLLPWAGLAQEAPNNLFGSRLIDAGEHLTSAAVVKDTIWLLSSQALYRYAPGDREAVQVAGFPGVYDNSAKAPPQMDLIFTHEDSLMGLDSRKGRIYRVEPKEGQPNLALHLQLDWKPFSNRGEDGAYASPPEFVTPFEGRLYCKAENLSDELKQDLYSFDLKTGAMKAHSPKHLGGLVPYKEGRLLGLYFNQMETEEVNGQFSLKAPRTMVFDPAKDSAEELPLTLPEDGRQRLNRNLIFYYSAEVDAVYAANTSALMRFSETEAPVVTGRLPLGGGYSVGLRVPSILPLGGAQVLISTGQNAFLRSTDEKALKPATELRFNAHTLDREALTRALLELPDITLVDDPGERAFSEDIIRKFMSKEISVDFLSMHSTNFPMKRLAEKGYLLDLSPNPELKAIGEDSFPLVKELVYQGDKLCFLPLSLDTRVPGAHIKRFQEIGRAIPRSIPELLDFTRWWIAEGHQQHPGYQIFETPGVKQSLRNLVNTVYVDSLLYQGKPLQYSMELFGKYMLEIEAMNTEDIEMPPALREEMQGNGDDNGDHYRFLMFPYMGYDAGRFTGPQREIQAMPLSIDGQLPPYRSSSLVAVGIPATTEHPEEARAFLAAFHRKLHAYDRAQMSPTAQGPVINPDYERTRASQEEILSMYRRQEANAPEGPQKRELRQIVQGIVQDMEMFEQFGRYLLTEEQLRQHQAFVQELYINEQMTDTSQMALVEKDGNNLMAMYGDGAISLEQFIQRANERIRLMTLEMQ